MFDLDDTLYLETDYVRSGFRAVAGKIEQAVETVPASELYTFLWESFEAGDRGNNFDRLLARYPEVAKVFSVGDLVRCYRNHYPDIKLFPEVPEVINYCKKKALNWAYFLTGFASRKN